MVSALIKIGLHLKTKHAFFHILRRNMRFSTFYLHFDIHDHQRKLRRIERALFHFFQSILIQIALHFVL